MDRKALSQEFVEKIEGWMWEKWSLLTVHLAIEGRPSFTALFYFLTFLFKSQLLGY